MEAKRNAYGILVGMPEGQRTLGRPRRRWMDNIKMDLGEIGWVDMDWINLGQDRGQWRALVNMIIKFWFHKMLGSCRVAVQFAASQEGLSSMKLV
jgi:hypothetical protein